MPSYPEGDLPWPLLDRYFAGECSAADRTVIEAWIAAHPDRARQLEALAETVLAPLDLPPVATADVLWSGIVARGLARRAEQRATRHLWPRDSRRRRLVGLELAGIAALALIAVVVVRERATARRPQPPSYSSAASNGLARAPYDPNAPWGPAAGAAWP